MAFIVENGGGIYGANSGVAVEYITNYLTERGRQTENSWDTIGQPAQEAAAIAATQYLELRFGNKFKGQKAFYFDGAFGSATITFSAGAANGDEVTIGYTTYTLSAGASATISGDDLVALVEAESDQIIASVVNDAGTVTVTLATSGEAGNYTPISATGANITASAFSGGQDIGEQKTSFPRNYLYDTFGNELKGMRQPYLWALCEYAIRAAGSTLLPDPTIDVTGKSVASNKKVVGPIEKTVVYSDGGAIDFIIRPYPAADKLLSPFIGYSNGGTIR